MDELPPPVEGPQDIYMREIKEKGLNNFYADVVGGYRRVGLKDDPEALMRKDPKRRMGKSMQEYWEDIDKVFIELGIDSKKVSNLQKEMISGKGNREDSLRELDKLLIPIYVRLREQGYTQLDLWQ